MTCFVDTSAFFAVLDADDLNHGSAKAEWESLLADSRTILVTTSYVLVETLALLQHRLGLEAVRVFDEDIYPLLRVDWVDADRHRSGMSGILGALRRSLSLVDCVSFDTMRGLGVRAAFTFDPHFAEQGFDCRPPSRRAPGP